MGLKIVLDTKEASRNADEFAKAIARVAKATGLAGKSADELLKSTAAMSRRFGRIGSSAEKAAGSISRMGTGMAKAASDVQKFDKAGSRAVASTDKLAKSVKRLAAGFLGIRAVTGSISTLAKLEQGIVTLGTVTGKTGASLKELQDVAVGVAQATKFTPTETIAALLELSRAGQSAAVAAESLISVADLAAAGVLDLGNAAGLVAASMAQFNKQGLGAAEAAGILVAVADRTKSTVTSLGSALSQAGQAAASFGIDMTQATAALGILQTAGVQASRTGRSLKTILSSLVTSVKTEKGKNALDILGLSAEDLTAKEGDLIGMLTRLKGALSNLSGTEQVDVLTTLVGKDFFANLATMADGVEDIASLVETTGEAIASGELGSKAAIQNDTLSGSIRDVASSFQELLLVAGDGGATGAMKGFFRSVAGAVRILGGVDGALGKASESAKTFASVMKGIGLALALRALISVGANLIGTLLSIKGAMLGVANAQGVISRTSPWGLITLGISAAVFALDSLNSKKREFAELQAASRREEETAQKLGSRFSEGLESRKSIKSLAPAEGFLGIFGISTRGADKSRLVERRDIEEATQALDALSSKFRQVRLDTGTLSAEMLDSLRSAMTDDQKTFIDTSLNLRKTLDYESKIANRGYEGGTDKARARFALAESRVAGIRKQLRGGVDKELEEQVLKQAREALASRQKISDERNKPTLASASGRAKSEAAFELELNLNVDNASIRLREFQKQFKEAIASQAQGDVFEFGVPTPGEIKKSIGDVNVELAKLRGADFDKDPALAVLTRKISDQKTDEIASLEKQRSLRKFASEAEREAAAQGRKEDAEGLKIGKEKTAELKKQAAIREKMSKFSLATGLKRVTDQFGDDLREQAEAAISQFNAARGAGFGFFESLGFGQDAASDVSAAQAAEADSKKRTEEFELATKEFESNKQSLEAIGSQFGNSLSQALLSIADGAKTAKEAFGDMAKTIIAQLIQMQLTKGFSQFFGSFSGSKPVEEKEEPGGGFSSFLAGIVKAIGSSAAQNQLGGVIPAQQGQILSSPTTLSRGGRNYSVSEGGGSTPEAVFPLTRNSKGQLSINASGGGGSTYNFSFPGIRNSSDAKATKRTIGQSVGGIIAASEAKKNRMGMRPKGR